jgi:hypothetical protein
VGVCADLVARLGLPALGALVFLATLALAVACWVLGSLRPGGPGKPSAARPGGASRLPNLMTPCRRRRCLRPSADGSCQPFVADDDFPILLSYAVILLSYAVGDLVITYDSNICSKRWILRDR